MKRALTCMNEIEFQLQMQSVLGVDHYNYRENSNLQDMEFKKRMQMSQA